MQIIMAPEARRPPGGSQGGCVALLLGALPGLAFVAGDDRVEHPDHRSDAWKNPRNPAQLTGECAKPCQPYH